MKTIIFYTRENCRLCEEAYVLLEILQQKYNFNIEKRDIETNNEWLEQYHVIIPVIEIGNTILNSNMIDLEIIDKKLNHYLNR